MPTDASGNTSGAKPPGPHNPRYGRGYSRSSSSPTFGAAKVTHAPVDRVASRGGERERC